MVRVLGRGLCLLAAGTRRSTSRTSHRHQAQGDRVGLPYQTTLGWCPSP